MNKALLALALATLAGCTVYVPVPDALMAGNDDSRLSDLRGGRDLYINKCSGCHALIPVDRFDDAKWTGEVEEMLRLKKVKLTRDEHDQLLRYLTAANGR
jgi:hypothetical protein